MEEESYYSIETKFVNWLVFRRCLRSEYTRAPDSLPFVAWSTYVSTQVRYILSLFSMVGCSAQFTLNSINNLFFDQIKDW